MNGVLVALACLVIAVSARSLTPQESLLNHLLSEYQRGVAPASTELVFGITVLRAKFDSQTEVATLNVWEFHKWLDGRLSWNPSEYSGVQELNIPADLVWTPDIKLYNSLSAGSERDDSARVIIAPNGTVSWIPLADYNVHCAKGGNEATCKLHLGSWTYDETQVSLHARDDSGVELRYYDPDYPLVISSHTAAVTSAHYPCCPQAYQSLDVTFTIKRRDDSPL